MKQISLFLFFLSISINGFAQKDFYQHVHFTEADTLRGMLRAERTCYDVHYYDLNILIDPESKVISGANDIYFTVEEDFTRLQIDLFENMEIKKIVLSGKELKYERIHNAVFIDCPLQKKGSKNSIRIHYAGQPITARRAPWDGGFVWTKDRRGNPWIGVACEGTGASLWWPNKDHLSDEPDSMSIRVAVPNDLFCVANGNLRGTKAVNDKFTQYNWFVSYPINNYNVTVNIADYAHFKDEYKSPDGSTLDLDYYVLKDNLEKAKEHFKQVPGVLQCFEHYFGKYPFWKDGYALVETPYLGMEHQGAIAYGNHYMRGYMGGMIPSDMDWDYIIVHETGHEYFGNSISCHDLAEMWIHESFTTYMEALYVECTYGYKDAVRYMNHFRNSMYIINKEPILGPQNVNWEDWRGSDHYFKGSWVLHTLRHVIDNDELWFDILKSFHVDNAMTNVHTSAFIQHVNKKTGKDYSKFFEQYLEYPSIPQLVYNVHKTDKGVKFSFKWDADVADFDMPIKVGEEDNYQMVYPTDKWQVVMMDDIDVDDFKVATELFYINIFEAG